MRAAPLFAYLLEGPPHVSYVGLASRPAQRLEAHNRTAGHSCSNKRTRRYAGQWRLTLVIGYCLSVPRWPHSCAHRETLY